MSADDTCAVQRRRLRQLGLSVGELPPLRDVDRIDDAYAAAAEAPYGYFASVLADLDLLATTPTTRAAWA